MSSCTFTSGGSTVAAYCEDGCCSDGCCSDDLTDGALIAIIIASVIGGLLLLLLLALCLWCLMRNKNKDGDDKKKLAPKKNNKDLEANKKKKNMLIGYAPTESYMTRKRPAPVKPTTYLERNKMTQTINHRSQPGDVILTSRGLFVPAKDESKSYQDYMQSNKSFEVGTSTDGRDTQSVQARKHSKLNSTANFYTRRNSLKGSSDEDDNLPSFRSTSKAPNSREAVMVNMYAFAARDSGSKTDYVIKDEKDKAKAQNVVAAFQHRWQPHTKGETQAQKQWKDAVQQLQEERKD